MDGTASFLGGGNIGPSSSDQGMSRNVGEEETSAWTTVRCADNMARGTPEERKTVHDDDTKEGLWLPYGVVAKDRRKAYFVWTVLLAMLAAYVVYLALNSAKRRKNPPITVVLKEESFRLPDVIFCPTAGDGCDSRDPKICADSMRMDVSAIGGFTEKGEQPLFETPAPTPAPTPYPFGIAPSALIVPGLSPSSSPAPLFSTPAPTAPFPNLHIPIDSTVRAYCKRADLSTFIPDETGIKDGSVRSLHASVYIRWSDQVAVKPVSSTRRFINTFFVDAGAEIEEAELAVRLPYDRVNITGSIPFTFLSNDVAVSLSQRVLLKANGDVGSTKRTYSQVTTSAQHTLQLENYGSEFSGAILYATFSVNSFLYQSVEEVDPVDAWALAGSAGGMWDIACLAFGICFVASHSSGPGRRWRFSRFQPMENKHPIHFQGQRQS